MTHSLLLDREGVDLTLSGRTVFWLGWVWRGCICGCDGCGVFGLTVGVVGLVSVVGLVGLVDVAALGNLSGIRGCISQCIPPLGSVRIQCTMRTL